MYRRIGGRSKNWWLTKAILVSDSRFLFGQSNVMLTYIEDVSQVEPHNKNIVRSLTLSLINMFLAGMFCVFKSK